MPLFLGEEQKEFFVWVDPTDSLVRHNMSLVGSFAGGTLGLGGGSPEFLQFTVNPHATPGVISPFHNNITYFYRLEYELELARHTNDRFRNYPSRLWALYLLDSKENALAYKKANASHVKGRILKRCITVGPYTYSTHDAAWIDFLRLKHSIDKATFENIAKAYWNGARTDQAGVEFISTGKSWTPKPVTEVLFYGRVDFPNKKLLSDIPEPITCRYCAKISDFISRVCLRCKC